MNIIPAALSGHITESASLLDTTAGRVRRTPDPLDVLAVTAAGSHPSPGELVAAGVASVDLVPVDPEQVAAGLPQVVAVTPCGTGQWVVTLTTGRRLRLTRSGVHRGR